MPAPNLKTFNADHLVFAAELKPNKAGGKYATVGYGDPKNQVEFQLGNSPKDALRCPWGVEPVSETEPDKLQIKLDLTEDAKALVERLEAATLRAAATHSVAWFKKSLNVEALRRDLNSSIKPSAKDEYADALKVKVVKDGLKPTKVSVATWKDGKLTKPIAGTLGDVVPGCMVLPILKIKGGVYFVQKSFGTSLAASELLVVKDEGASSGTSGFDFGDVQMTDAEEDEQDE